MPEWEEWDRSHVEPCRLVAVKGAVKEAGPEILGWAALSPVSDRCVYECGFRTVGLRKRLGKMHGMWRDVVFMERRGDRVGVE